MPTSAARAWASLAPTWARAASAWRASPVAPARVWSTAGGRHVAGHRLEARWPAAPRRRAGPPAPRPAPRPPRARRRPPTRLRVAASRCAPAAAAWARAAASRASASASAAAGSAQSRSTRRSPFLTACPSRTLTSRRRAPTRDERSTTTPSISPEPPAGAARARACVQSRSADEGGQDDGEDDEGDGDAAHARLGMISRPGRGPGAAPRGKPRAAAGGASRPAFSGRRGPRRCQEFRRSVRPPERPGTSARIPSAQVRPGLRHGPRLPPGTGLAPGPGREPSPARRARRRARPPGRPPPLATAGLDPRRPAPAPPRPRPRPGWTRPRPSSSGSRRPSPSSTGRPRPWPRRGPGPTRPPRSPARRRRRSCRPLLASGGYTRNSDEMVLNLGALKAILPSSPTRRSAGLGRTSSRARSGAAPSRCASRWWPRRPGTTRRRPATAPAARRPRPRPRASRSAPPWPAPPTSASPPRSSLAASERAAANAARLAESARRKLEAGTAAPLDLLRARTEEVRRQGDLVRARAELDRLRRAAGTLLGREVAGAPPGGPADRRPSLPAAPRRGAAGGRGARPAAPRWRRRRPRWPPPSRRSARPGRGWPPSSRRAAPPSPPTSPTRPASRQGWRATLDLTWSLYDGGFRYGKRREAEARLAGAQAAAEAQRLAVRQEVRDAAARRRGGGASGSGWRASSGGWPRRPTPPPSAATRPAWPPRSTSSTPTTGSTRPRPAWPRRGPGSPWRGWRWRGPRGGAVRAALAPTGRGAP